MRRRSAFPPVGDRRCNCRGSPVTAPARSPPRPIGDNTDFAHDSFTRGSTRKVYLKPFGRKNASSDNCSADRARCAGHFDAVRFGRQSALYPALALGVGLRLDPYGVRHGGRSGRRGAGACGPHRDRGMYQRGGRHPKATNKTGVAVAGDFPVQNGKADFTLTATAAFQPSCTPPMTVVFVDVVLTDTTNGITANIPGTLG